MAIILPCAFVAQTAVAEGQVDATAVAKARQLIEMLGVTENMDKVVPRVMDVFANQIEQDNPGQGAIVKELMNTKVWPRIRARLPEFVELVADIYAKHFTDSELQQLIDFYKTPVGEKFLRERAEVVAEIYSVAIPMMSNIARDVLRDQAPEFEKRGLKMPKI